MNFVSVSSIATIDDKNVKRSDETQDNHRLACNFTPG